MRLSNTLSGVSKLHIIAIVFFLLVKTPLAAEPAPAVQRTQSIKPRMAAIWNYDDLGNIAMCYKPPSGTWSVSIVGSFNDWNPLSTPMSDLDRDGVWTVQLPLVAGVYQYKFVVNESSTLVHDPANPNKVSDGHYGYNSVLTVTSASAPDISTTRQFESSSGQGDEPALTWVRSTVGEGEINSNAIAVLSDKSVVVTGSFRGTTTFGAGEANQTQLVPSGWRGDIFVARYNPDGTLAWARRVGGWSSGGEISQSVAVLSDNSIIITGYFSDTITLDNGTADQAQLVTAQPAFYIARYYYDGTLAWAKRVGGTNFSQGNTVAVLSDNSFVIRGSFSGRAPGQPGWEEANGKVTFGEGEANQTQLTSTGGHDGGGSFLARYNPDGTLAWARRMAGRFSSELADAIAVLSDNSIVVTGEIDGTTTFGDGDANETDLVASDKDFFIARYNPDGTLAWVKDDGRTGYGSSSGSCSIAALSDNSIVVAGVFGRSVTFGAGEANETQLNSSAVDFIARYNADGTLAWAKCAANAYEASLPIHAVAVLSDNSFIVTGDFRRNVTFDSGEVSQRTLTETGTSIYQAKYDEHGRMEWARTVASNASNAIGGVSRTAGTTVYLTGSYGSNTRVLPGTQGEIQLLDTDRYRNNRGCNIFIARFDLAPLPADTHGIHNALHE